MTHGTRTLEATHLEHSFGAGALKSTVLRDISIDLFSGQLTLLMGPSGSGKSTLMAVLSGLLRPQQGRVVALGQDVWSLGENERRDFRLRHCGFIFQGYNLFRSLTVREQLEMVLRWGERTPRAEARRRVDEMLEELGLAGKADNLPHHLSGGEKQRVAIGRAMIKRPTFCFADEPTSALDWAHGQNVIELLRTAAHESGASVLVVAHEARIIPFADCIYHLQDGCLTTMEPSEMLTH